MRVLQVAPRRALARRRHGAPIRGRLEDARGRVKRRGAEEQQPREQRGEAPRERPPRPRAGGPLAVRLGQFGHGRFQLHHGRARLDVYRRPPRRRLPSGAAATCRTVLAARGDLSGAAACALHSSSARPPPVPPPVAAPRSPRRPRLLLARNWAAVSRVCAAWLAAVRAASASSNRFTVAVRGVASLPVGLSAPDCSAVTILGDGTGGGEDRGEFPSTLRSTTRRRSPARRSCAGVPDARRVRRAAVRTAVGRAEGYQRRLRGDSEDRRRDRTHRGASCGVLSAGGGGGAAAAVRSAKHSPQVPPSAVSSWQASQ